jgi:predicted DNA-binding transcriptional regulator AlpA
MRKTEPQTFPQFLRWLQAEFDDMDFYCRHAEADYFEQLQIGETVEQACRLACRFGGGHLIGKEQGVVTPREALVVLGRLLAWAREECSKGAGGTSLMLTANDLAEMLGIDLRSVWRRKADGTLPQPVQLGRSVRWMRKEVEQWLAGN